MKIFIYKQKLEKKVQEFYNHGETTEKIESLKLIQKELMKALATLSTQNIIGVSESKVRASLIVIRDFVTNLNEKFASEDNRKVLKKISSAFDSGEEDELFAIHTYVDEIIASNKKATADVIALLKNANDEYLEALHSLKSESNSDAPKSVGLSVEDLKDKINGLNQIIARAGNQKIQGIDLESLKKQLNDAVEKLQSKGVQHINTMEDNDSDLNDNEHYGKLLNQMMGDSPEQAFDNGNTQIDLNEGSKTITHNLPKSFTKAVEQYAIHGTGNIEDGIDDYMTFTDRIYDLNDVQKLLAKKRKDRMMENFPHICGKEIMMWVKQELEAMLMDFQKAGLHPLQRIEAVKDLNYGLADVDDNIDNRMDSIKIRCRNQKRRF